MPQGVRVDDIVIHPRERDLVIGTHGRGIWIMDIAPLEQLSEKVLAADAYLFDVKPVTPHKLLKRDFPAMAGWKASNPPAGPVAAFLLNGPGPERVKFQWKSDAGETGSADFAIPGPGLHWRPLGELKPGNYSLSLEARGVTVSQKFMVNAEEK